MTYMQGATEKGLALITKITKLINSLTEDDFDETYLGLRVSITEEDEPYKEIGRWFCEYGYGNWAYFDGDPKERELGRPEPVTALTDESISAAIESTPTAHMLSQTEIDMMTDKIMKLVRKS